MASARTELVHCDNCGEDYAATYRRCPFCNAKPGQRLDDYDEADYDQYDDAPRRGGRRLSGGTDPTPGDPAKIAIYALAALVLLAVICILISVVIPKLVSPADPSAAPTDPVDAALSPAVTDAVPSAAPSDEPSSFHPLPGMEGMDNDDPLSLDSPYLPPVESDPISPVTSTPPVTSGATAKLTYAGRAIEDFTINAQNPDPITLKVQGGTAQGWSVKNTSVATVSSTGTVTGVGNGTTTVECALTDGSVLTCTVRVSGLSGQSSQSGQTTTSQAPSNSAAKLTYGGRAISEFSITAQYPDPITLKVQGGTAQSWSSKNTSVATVSSAGTVTGVGNGTTKIQCTLTDGTVLTCEVRVSK